ncbi:hypothetical protein [Photobacterium damselae]|uniref:hypothetical protein n=2 Tax=Photobacterium damselae TaxID=38293 RepID=UPI001F46327A|nr:hypothetical protein [Photobacterium damselae]UKA31025.1 hypothetical protein IPQ37_19970 [Photobacterium damselae subsp. damselae]
MADILNITGNETVEELDAMLAMYDDAGVEENGNGVIEGSKGVIDQGNDIPNQDNANRSEVDSHAASAPATDVKQLESGHNGELPPVIMAKDGVHTIPYDVLESQRRETERLRHELSSMTEQLSQAQQTDRLLDLRNKQLEQLGVEPADLPENFKLTDDVIASLTEDYPEIAPVITAMNAQMEQLAASVQQQPTGGSAPVPEQDEVLVALRGNQELSGWQSGDPDKWSLALDIDDALRIDPVWQHKSCAERFEEVVRQTKQKFGEVTPDNAQEIAKAKAQEAQQKAEASLPASPSELSTGDNTHDGSLLQRAAGMSSEELSGLMSNMTPQQIEALLEQSDDF